MLCKQKYTFKKSLKIRLDEKSAMLHKQCEKFYIVKNLRNFNNLLKKLLSTICLHDLFCKKQKLELL